MADTTPDISVLAVESKHQGLALQRIELKLDKSLDDHEHRLRELEARLARADSERAALIKRVDPLEVADKRWGVVAMLSGPAAALLLRVLWP